MGCEATEIKKSGESRIGRPDAESWQATITLTNEGAKRAVIRSGHLEKYNERQYILLDQNVDAEDRKSTRLNSSHKPISYAVFCLKKKNKKKQLVKRDNYARYGHHDPNC